MEDLEAKLTPLQLTQLNTVRLLFKSIELDYEATLLTSRLLHSGQVNFVMLFPTYVSFGFSKRALQFLQWNKLINFYVLLICVIYSYLIYHFIIINILSIYIIMVNYYPLKTSDYLTKIFFSFSLRLPQRTHFFWESRLANLHFEHTHTIFSLPLKNQSFNNRFKNLVPFYINDFFIILMFGGNN